MHRVLSVGSLEVTDKAQQPKGVSLDALVAAAIRGVAAILAFASRDELLDTTLELYHGDADMYWDLPAMIKDLDGAAASEALWDATVASNGGVEWD